MKRLVFFLSAVVVVAGTATSQGVGYGLEVDFTMEQAITAAAEKDHRPQIWELRIEDSLEDYEEALEDSEDAIDRTYANDERWNMSSIQNKKEIYLIPLMNWYGLTDYKTSSLVQEDQTEADAADAWMNLYVAQKSHEQASREFELAKLELEALQVREKAGAVITSQVNAQALAVLQQELTVQQSMQNVELAAKKLAYWTGLEVEADSEMGMPKMTRSIYAIPQVEKYVNDNLLVTEAVWKSLYSYETTVLNIQAIEDGFRGPNFEENQPDSYQTYVIDQMEGAFALEEALVNGEQALLAELNNLENKSLMAINQKTNRENREKEWAATEIRYQAGAISTLEYDTARLNLEKAELAEVEAVYAWNKAVAGNKRQQSIYAKRTESMDETWMSEMKIQVAAWAYDPDAVHADTDEAYIDWILTKNGISPSILDEAE
jgi:hypothetical protein